MIINNLIINWLLKFFCLFLFIKNQILVKINNWIKITRPKKEKLDNLEIFSEIPTKLRIHIEKLEILEIKAILQLLQNT